MRIIGLQTPAVSLLLVTLGAAVACGGSTNDSGASLGEAGSSGYGAWVGTGGKSLVAGGAAATGSAEGGTGSDLGLALPIGGAGSRETPGSPVTLSTPVKVLITADNAYGFGYGSEDSLQNYFGGIENVEADQIFSCPVGFGPEEYVVPADSANEGNYLYIIGYADKAVTQGVLGQFQREGANAVFTGVGEWEGCATGLDYDLGNGGPPLATINEAIKKCNAGGMDASTTTVGWVNSVGTAAGKVAFGEDNSTDRTGVTVGNEFPLVCTIEKSARWMWLDWDPAANQGSGRSAFIWPGGTGNATKDFVIFRLGAKYVPSPIY